MRETITPSYLALRGGRYVVAEVFPFMVPNNAAQVLIS